MEQIAERVKNAPVFPTNSYETDAEICIDNILIAPLAADLRTGNINCW